MGRRKSGGQFRTSWTETQYHDSFSLAEKLFDRQLLHRQHTCTPTEKKGNKKPIALHF